MPYRAYFHALRQHVENKILTTYARAHAAEFVGLWIYWHDHIEPLCERYFATWKPFDNADRRYAQETRSAIVFRLLKAPTTRIVKQFSREIYDRFEAAVLMLMQATLVDLSIARKLGRINAEARASGDPIEWVTYTNYRFITQAPR
jgi:hypothetical protein